MSNPLLQELQRREVLKTAGIYAGAAWLITQILLAVIDRSPLPEATRALVGCVAVSVFILGFPVAVVLAWFFDVTRSGVARDRPTDRGQLMKAVASLVLVVVATGAILWRVSPCTFGSITGIAVLPCSYYGPPGSESQAAGLARELNYRLSHLPDLRVPAWTSTVAASKQAADPAKLASTLGTERLVECSVRRAGERLTVTAQLYDPVDDRNLWGMEIEGQSADELLLVADLFQGLIGEKALRVGSHYRERIDRANRPPTPSFEAWSTYRDACDQEDSGRYGDALESFRRSVLLDPQFARARTGAARMLWQSAQLPGVTAEAHGAALNAAMLHVQLALRSEPELAEALALRRVLRAEGAKEPPMATDPAKAESARDDAALHAQVIALRPSYADEYYWWSGWLRERGKKSEAAEALAQARTLDPLGTLERRSPVAR
jgi:TolB-like protein